MSSSIRIRRLIAYQGRILAIVALLISIVAFGLAYSSYQNPPVERVSETIDQQTFESQVVPSAVVTGNTTLFEPQQRLVNRSAFLTTATPELRLAVTSTSTAPAATMDHRLILELRATLNDRAFWTEERVLTTQKGQVDGDEIATNTTLDIPELQTRLQVVRSELGAIGSVQARLRLSTNYDSERYNGTLSTTAPIQITENAYWIDGELAASRQETTTRTQRLVQSPNPVLYGGYGLFGLLSLFAAMAILLMRRRGIDLEALETELDHERYEEWISNGEFPTGAEKRYITINSLEDLVDIAIDSNKRVIRDESLEAYAVTDGDIVYYYSQANQRLESWLDL